MNAPTPLRPSQRVVQIILFLFAAIALFGGTVQMFLGQPETTPRLDNVHRFLAGIYFGCGRLWSISVVGLPQPSAVWLGYMIPELVLPWVMFAAHTMSKKSTPSQELV